MSEQNREISAKSIAISSRPYFTTAGANCNVLHESSENNQLSQKERIHQSKVSINRTCGRARSKRLNQGEAFDKDPTVAIPSRILHLYESRKEKIRMKRSRTV